MLGLGFLAAIAGLAGKSKEQSAVDASAPFGTARIAHGIPVWFGVSQKAKRTNRLKFSKNAKLKRRRAN